MEGLEEKTSCVRNNPTSAMTTLACAHSSLPINNNDDILRFKRLKMSVCSRLNDEEEEAFSSLVLSCSSSIESFDAFLENIGSIDSNAKALPYIFIIPDTKLRCKIAACLSSDPTSPKCHETLLEAIRRTDIHVMNTLLLQGVPYSIEESEMCRHRGLHHVAELMSRQAY